VCKGHRQCTIRTRFERQPFIRFCRSRRQPRFNNGYVCTVDRITPNT
jgi:hypothetical protein